MCELFIAPALLELFTYIEKTWFRNSTWDVVNWSGYRRVIRTNNDCEGWHRRLNSRAGKDNIVLYLLIPLLHRESEFVSLQHQLVSEHKLTSSRRKASRDQQVRLCKLWDDYEQKNQSTGTFLKACQLLVPPPSFNLTPQ